MAEVAPGAADSRRLQFALLASVFVVAACGLAYELIAGALASYLLGDSVTQFSTIIGAYLFAMGVGSWLSKFVTRDLIGTFIKIELAVGVIGGFAAAGLFVAFAAQAGPFRVLLYGAVFVVGVLVGLEIPLVMRILKHDIAFNELVARVLSFDYLGALAVSILFPLLLAPHLGLVRTGFLFGLLNAAVALWALWLFRERLARRTGLRLAGATTVVVLAGGLAGAGHLTTVAEGWIYADDIIHAENTPYQRIVVTRWHDDVRLFLNQNLQFSSRDEYRYHEALVHPGLAGVAHARRVLVLGGGDGFAVREVLKYPNIEAVTLVDLDPAMTRLFSTASLLRELNGDALNSPKLKTVNADAVRWLEDNEDLFDFIVVDFPDPSSYSLGKLYSAPFYRLLARHLAPHGRLVVQATSPFYARRSYWTVVATLEDAGLRTAPYHALVPSFGEWGFILASREAYQPPEAYAVPLRFLTAPTTAAMFDFPADMARVETEVNRLSNQVLVRTFESEWRHVVR
ncbi:MAG: polyamine aminopropyltransferase [Gammaproteobacteria bacterium]|nr:polyamine aminopropyltransferase [Gammaproteobacteria bacterium]MBU1645333.1 polyamine aminopropyltransferase [Gammaproteobacteria bacterium]MBU1972326.1 polyamine aminopropyltransferase [Gammaproteobacteria bacterium]